MKRKLDINETQVVATKRTSVKFGSSFRKKLHTEDAMSALNDFVRNSEEREVVTEYMNAGGSATEILAIMKQFDGKKDLAVANTVFSALGIIILKTSKDLLLIQRNVEEACQELLCTYLPTMQNMLKAHCSAVNHKGTVMRLLTGMITLSDRFAEKILTLFPMNSKLLKSLTDVRSSSTKRLRTYFIHYLISFLVSDNSVVITELLNKKGLLTSIIPGLMYDQPATVALVLETLRMKIVENTKISKTLKMRAFNSHVLASISKLYDYEVSFHEESCSEGEPKDVVQSIRVAVHRLLVLLCTSSKKGILFHEKRPDFGNSSNELILTLLECMKTPWNDELKSELIIRILKVCPEFSKKVFERSEPYLQPNISTDWIQLMAFVKQIIEEHSFDFDKPVDEQLLTTIASYCFPRAIKKLFGSISDVVHPDPTIRYEIISLMECILRKFKTVLAHYEKTISLSQFFGERVELLLNKNSIPCRSIINAWNVGVNVVLVENVTRTIDDEHIILPSNSRYFNLLADVLLLYENLCPSYFNHLRVEENIHLTDVDIDCPEFHFKRAELIFHVFDPKPDQDQFASMVHRLIECYIPCNAASPTMILKKVFLKTGFFDGFEEEIIVWLYSVKKVGLANPSVVSSLLTDTFSAMIKHNKRFIQDLTVTVCEGRDTSLREVDLPQHFECFLDLSEEFWHISKSGIQLSPMIPAFLNVLKSYEQEKTNYEIIKSFTSHFFVHLLHLQCDIRGLLAIVNKYKNPFVDSRFFNYVSFWNCEKLKLKYFKYPLTDENAMSKLGRQFIKGDCLSEIMNVVEEVSESERVLIWNMCTFYAIQFNNHSMLDTKTVKKITRCLKAVLKQLQSDDAFSCLRSLLTAPSFINSFFCGSEQIFSPLFRIVIEMSSDFTGYCSSIVPDCQSVLLSPYRSRFVLFLLNEMEQRKNIIVDRFGCEIESVFQFIMLPNKTAIRLLNLLSQLSFELLIDKDKRLSGWSTILQQLLKIITANLQTPMEKESFLLLLDLLPPILKLNIVPDGLEEALIDYLKSFPHHLHHIPNDFVITIITFNSNIDKLALFLMPYFPESFLALKEKILENVPRLTARALLKVAQVAGHHDVILQIICENYLNELTNWTDDEFEWDASDVPLISTIFSNFAERKICSKQCKKIESEWLEMNLNVNKCRVIRAIYGNVDKIGRYVEMLIIKFNKILFEDSADWISPELCEALHLLNASDFRVNRTVLQKFGELCLNVSLRTNNATLVRALKILYDKFYSAFELDDVDVIFQKMITHFRFIDVMLCDSDIKRELIDFFWILTRKNKSLMSSNHIPLLLGAYNATLSETDQSLLQVLLSYEENEIRFTDCRPYLWGSAAIVHYNVRAEINVSLKRQPQSNQVLDLLDIDVINNTIRYFPLNRSLWPEKHSHLDFTRVYDPCFMLPLFSHLLAPESRISVRKVTRSGALSYILMALSSSRSNVRTAAFHCLLRFSSHLASHDKEIQIWEHFVNALKNGVLSVECEDDLPPQLPFIVTTFLARMCLIISEPLHTLYAPLTNFLLSKQVFDMNVVPNFLILCYSTDMKCREHREWILKVIRDGMRDKLDWAIARKCYLFKLLLQFNCTAVSDLTTNTIILDTVANALQIWECRLYLITKFGLMSWISQIVRHLPENKNFLSSIVKILKSASIKKSRSVIRMILLLFTKLTPGKINSPDVEELMHIFSSTYCSCKNEVILGESDVELVLRFAAPFLDAGREEQFRNCLKYKSVVGIKYELDRNLTSCLVKILSRFIGQCQSQ